MSISPVAVAQLLELQHRRTIRSSLLAWATEVLAPLGQAPALHHRLLIAELEWVARTPGARLMLLLPPGHGKSTYATKLFPPWFLAQDHGLSVIAASHTAELAESFSKKCQEIIREHSLTLGYELTSEAAALWSTSTGGAFRAAGVGGPIAGHRGDLIIVDDAIRNREDAQSPRKRETIWDWYRSDVLSRLKPGGRLVIINTRWHESDLSGMLLQTERAHWKVVCLPALALPGDALGRPEGAVLWPTYYSSEILEERRRAVGERDWSALYQQDPRPDEGGLFTTDRFTLVDMPPAGRHVIRSWDLASTAAHGTSRADWTCGVKMMRDDNDRYVVLDVQRLRVGPEGVADAIVNTAAADGKNVAISLPKDPGQAGASQVLFLTKRLSGYTVRSSPESGDKSTRAMPFASQVNVGNVSLVKASWNALYLDELQSFPSGTWDDQVDASSRSFNELATKAWGLRMVSVGFDSRPAGVERYADGRRTGIDRSRVGQQCGEDESRFRSLDKFLEDIGSRGY